MSTFISEFLLGGNGKRVAIKDSKDGTTWEIAR